MEDLTPHRNQTMNLQCRSIDWFLSDLSLHQKGLLNSPEKNFSLENTQV